MRSFLLFLALSMMAGCGGAAPTSTGTGARETATSFFEAITRQNWEEAYKSLHGDSRKVLSLADFSNRGKNYRKGLGFELGKVVVRLCEEQGDKANAHLVLSDANDSRKNSFREAVLLRKDRDRWGVILSPNFGIKR